MWPAFSSRVSSIVRTWSAPCHGCSARMSCRWGSAPAKLPRAASPVQTDNVAYSLRSGRASRAKPMTPSVTRSCLRTALAPRNKRQVERRLRGGADAGQRIHDPARVTWSTAMATSRCSVLKRALWVGGRRTRDGADASDGTRSGASQRTSACSTVVSGGEPQDRLGEWCWVEAEGEVPLAWKAVQLSSRQQFGYFVRSRGTLRRPSSLRRGRASVCPAGRRVEPIDRLEPGPQFTRDEADALSEPLPDRFDRSQHVCLVSVTPMAGKRISSARPGLRHRAPPAPDRSGSGRGVRSGGAARRAPAMTAAAPRRRPGCCRWRRPSVRQDGLRRPRRREPLARLRLHARARSRGHRHCRLAHGGSRPTPHGAGQARLRSGRRCRGRRWRRGRARVAIRGRCSGRPTWCRQQT